MLCECGCGQKTKPGNRFIHGHNNKGKKFIRSDCFGVEMSKIKKQQHMENPNWGKEHKIRMAQYYKEHPKKRKEAAKRTKKQYSTQEARDEQSKRIILFNKKHPEAVRENRKRGIKQFESQEARNKMSEVKKQHYKNNPDTRKKLSAVHQGISYEEWDGFSSHSFSGCIFLNEPFDGCHRHHMTKTKVICLPAKLHRSVDHCLKTGYNMNKINSLALQYVKGV